MATGKTFKRKGYGVTPIFEIPVDRKLAVQVMASLHLSVKTMAIILDCHPKTIENRFKRELALGREQIRGKLMTKAIQLATCEKPNIAMLIFLLKNMCGMSDKVESMNVNVNANTTVPLTPDRLREILSADPYRNKEQDNDEPRTIEVESERKND